MLLKKRGFDEKPEWRRWKSVNVGTEVKKKYGWS